MTGPARVQRGVTFALRGPAMVARVRQMIDTNAAARARFDGARAQWSVQGHDDATPPQIFDELETYREELAVAEEELHAQIDELTRLGSALRRERTRYRELFEEAADAYLVTDTRGVVVEANEMAGKLLGKELRFLHRKPLAALIEAAHVASFRQLLLAATPAATFSLRVPTIRRGTDPELWIELDGHVSGDGARIRWRVRHAAAEQAVGGHLEEERAALEQHVSQRIAEVSRSLRDKDDLLARERILREELEMASAAKDRFLAVLSHDLRGPLNAVLGWTSLLRREHLDTKTRDKALATIERNALLQSKLIEELLDVSRIGAGKMQLESRLLDFGDLARKSIDAVTPAARDKGIELVDRTTRDPVLVLGDVARLQQVLANLLGNAIKFTPDGGRIEVSLTTNSFAHFAIADSGRGISADVLPFVFDCFRQSSDAVTGRQGLGLGLYIVRHLVEMHGGTVKAESEGEGRGSRFHVILPVRDPAAVANIPDAPDSSVASAGVRVGEMDLTDCRVLLVDDDQDTRELLSGALTRAGAEVMTAAEGRSALDAFDTFGPDVVVSDIGLPELDGLELVRRLRSSGAGADVVAIAMSGFAGANDAKSALAAGFDAHLAKPFRVEDLVTAITSARRNRSDD